MYPKGSFAPSNCVRRSRDVDASRDTRRAMKRLGALGAAVLFATVTPWLRDEVRAGHGASPSPSVPVPTAPLEHCRPVHLSADPASFQAPVAARGFRVFVD